MKTIFLVLLVAAITSFSTFGSAATQKPGSDKGVKPAMLSRVLSLLR
jgi:hypothetical protein